MDGVDNVVDGVDGEYIQLHHILVNYTDDRLEIITRTQQFTIMFMTISAIKIAFSFYNSGKEISRIYLYTFKSSTTSSASHTFSYDHLFVTEFKEIEFYIMTYSNF